MKNKIILVIFSISIILLFLMDTNNGAVVIGEIEEIKYFSSGISIKLNGQESEFIIFENIILDINKKDIVEIKFSKQNYKNKEQNIIERIIKF